MMMDDWGSQRSLLIDPAVWIRVFKPLYRDYIDIARRYGKKTFMHSDGYTLPIIPQLIELGLDAINTQIFCIGLDNLARFRGQITFWGEVDRQHLLADASAAEVRQAVSQVDRTLWQGGGCIAQCEFGVGAKPQNVRAVFETWMELHG
jgi:uroporphyrinogen decarboxylase